MKIIVNGVTGHMGRILADKIRNGQGGHSFAAGIDPCVPSGQIGDCYAALGEFQGDADMVIDFSHHSAAPELMEYCLNRKLPVIVCTTGHTDEEKQTITAASRSIPVFFSANMSLGVAALSALSRRAAELFPDADIEIVEKHHNRKLDVPSGTALMLFEEIRKARPDAEAVVGRHENGKRRKNEIGIHSLRCGNLAGVHEIVISTGSETLTLCHEVGDRSLFADGALAAAEFLRRQPPGLYTMSNLANG